MLFFRLDGSRADCKYDVADRFYDAAGSGYKKNAILLVDYANQARAKGMPLREALREACALRIRPIFMTTLSTILGMLPIALGLGAGAELRQSMGVVLVGGLTTSTLLTLVVVPLLYLLSEEWKEKHLHKS